MIASTNPFEILAPPLASLLAFFYDHVLANYGVAIILMTLTVMLVLAPLTWKGTRSMLAMQRLAPELKRLQQQHKNDRQALNEATMALYKEHGVNPLGGCLPLLLQMPVFFGLFRSISGLTHKVKGKDGVTRVIPKFINANTRLAKDLGKAHGTMKAFGIDLAKAASSHHATFWAALPYLAIVAGIIFTGWYQQRQLTSRNPQAAAANPQAQLMQKIFPVFFGLITYRFPAGVALYWLTSSVVRIVQQWAMYRWDPSLTKEVARDIEEVEERTEEIDRSGGSTSRTSLASPDGGRKGFFARMMEAAATQQEAKGQRPAKGGPAKPVPGQPGGEKAGTDKAGTDKPANSRAAPKPRPAPGAKPPATKPPAARPPAAKNGSNGAKPDQPAPKPATNRPASRKRRGR